MDSVHLSTLIDCSPSEAYEFARDLTNLPSWAAGLSTGVHLENGVWVSDSPMGRVVLDFAETNTFGVLDHVVTLATGERFYNPMRVVAMGDGCEVVFTLRRQPSMTDDEFARDRAAVEADLASLKALLED
jgi:hypothetical protein